MSKALKNTIKKFLLEQKGILIVFICIECIRFLSSLYYSNDSEWVNILRLIGLIFNFIMFCLAYRGYNFAIWIMAFIIFITGISTFIGSIFLFIQDQGQFSLKSFGILIGGYFTYGGVKVYRSRKKGIEQKVSEKTENL